MAESEYWDEDITINGHQDYTNIDKASTSNTGSKYNYLSQVNGSLQNTLNHRSGDSAHVTVERGATIEADHNASISGDFLTNNGDIEVTNGSYFNIGGVFKNTGTFTLDDSSIYAGDLVNEGDFTIGDGDEKNFPTYLEGGSVFQNNKGTLTFDNVRVLDLNGDKKYLLSENTNQEEDGYDYKRYTFKEDASGKSINELIDPVLDPDTSGSQITLLVRGGTVNIKDSEIGELREELADDDDDEVLGWYDSFGLDYKVSRQLGNFAPGAEAFNEIYIDDGTLNLENSKFAANYVTQNGGVINVKDSTLYSYEKGEFAFNKGTVNIIAESKNSVVGCLDISDAEDVKGTKVTIGKDATVSFKGSSDSAKAILNAASLINNGNLVFANGYYAINTPDVASGFDMNNNGKLDLNAASESLKTTNLKNTGNGILNINTGADTQIEIKSIASTGGSVNAKNSNIKTSDVTLTGNTKAEFGTLESSGTIAVGSATAGAAQVHIDKLVAGKIQADPDWSSPSLVSVAAMGTDGTTTVDDISAGRNSAVVFGSTSNTQAASLVSQAGGLSEGRTQAMLYLNKALKVKTGTGITIDGTQETPTVSADTLTLGKNSALVLGESIVTAALKTDVDGSSGSDTAALTFENGAGTVNFTDSSKVILDTTGAQIGQTYRIFEDTTTLTNSDGTSNGLYLTSRNNNVKATIGTDGVTTALEQNYTRDTLKGMSASVYEAADAAMHGGSGNGINFLSSVVGNSLRYGQEAESAARLAQFGGVYQNALMATSVLDEAVNTRLGVASSGSHFMYTDNALGTGMWIAPIYKQHTSDSFDSDGLDYGAKIRMGGVSLGGDYSFANGLRAGLAVTIGKSDIDGKEGADGVDNDSSFYGFALYGGYKYDAFSIATDIGYTKIKNSLDYETGLEGFGKISADADVTAYHAATTAQYEFDLGRLAVTPHAGLRFVSFDVDDYSVNSASGAIANTKNDRVNIFSVPVGVTLSHEFTNGDFRIKPAADLRVTVNSGDTDIDYKTRFIGSSADTKLNADIIDTVTYGIELGVAASYQKNLSFGVSTNYTGSSDAKEFGFNLSSRYAF